MPAASRPPGFMEGVIIALGLSLISAIGYWSLIGVFHVAVSLSAAAAILGTAYALYLIKRSDRTTGKITCGLVFNTIVVLIILLPIGVGMVASILLLALWGVRCFFYRHGVADSLVDLSLSVSAAIAALIAAIATQSVFITVWTFFIVQALHVFIPKFGGGCVTERIAKRHFETAYANAEKALRQYYSSGNYKA